MDVFRKSRKSLVPCIAAGGMKEYAEFIKERNFSPMTVLDPDLGMDGEIFAKDKTKGRGKEETIEAGGNSSLEAAHTNMSELLNKIEETAKSTIKGLSSITAISGPRNCSISAISGPRNQIAA